MDNYTLLNKIDDFNATELAIKNQFPPTLQTDWKNPRYETIKQRIKHQLYINQIDRCAFCRKIVEADGYYEPLEHIVAKSEKPSWMLEPKNLLLLCDSCNNLKGTYNTLEENYIEDIDLPQFADAYVIFNPHYDEWENHLAFDDDLFLVAKPNSKGAATIIAYQLYRYNVIINRAKEKKLGQKDPSRRVIHKLANLDNTNPIAQEIKDNYIQAMDHFLDRMHEMDGY